MAALQAGDDVTLEAILQGGNDRRNRYLDLFGVTTLLEHCVIEQNYRIPDDLVRPFVLTSLGEEIRTTLSQRGRRVKPNELRMAIALEMECPAGLLVSEDSNLEEIRDVISAELRRQRILLPYIFGRNLHDEIVDRYPAQVGLTNAETVAVLRATTTGVFQVGHLVTGPFGCLMSDAIRYMPPTYNVPGYLCGDETCSDIHPFRLSTGNTAISRTREIVSEYMQEKYAGVEDKNSDLIGEAWAEALETSRRPTSDGIFEMLSDSFSLSELRAVIADLLRFRLKKDGGPTSLSRQLSVVVASPDDLVSSLEQPQLIQIAMLFQDAEIGTVIDREVKQGLVTVKDFQVRSRRLTRFGDPDRAEVGPLGFRLTSTMQQFVSLRLHMVLNTIFFSGSYELDSEDLAYVLELPEGSSSAACIDKAVLRMSPNEVISGLVNSQRRVAKALSTELGLENWSDFERPELIERLLWKLGIPSYYQFADVDDLAKAEQTIRSSIESGRPEDVLRGDGSNLFAKLEDTLQLALLFSCWALTRDHYLDAEPFMYKVGLDWHSFEFVQSRVPVDPELELKSSGRNTIAPLASGFGRLARALREVDPNEFVRPKEQFPPICRRSGRPFFLPCRLPYLCLSEDSQKRVRDDLQMVAKLVQDETVTRVRNSMAHGNTEFPTTAEILVAVDRLAECQRVLTVGGLYPQVYRWAEVRTDVSGHSVITYRSSDQEVTLETPVWTIVRKLPTSAPYLIMVPAADLKSVGVLRFRLDRQHDPDGYWKGFPARMRLRQQMRERDFVSLGDDLGHDSLAG